MTKETAAQKATPSITTVQHLDYSKALAFATAHCDAFNKAGVSMIAACGVVMFCGTFGQDKKMKFDDIKKTLTDNLQKRGLGPTQISKYISYALDVARQLIKRDSFGGDVHRILIAKSIDDAHKVLMNHLNQLTNGKNTLQAVAIAIGKEAPPAHANKSQASAAEVLQGNDAKAAKRREAAVKVVAAQPEALAKAPDVVRKAAEVIGFTRLVRAHVEHEASAKALLAFKKAVDNMVTERIKELEGSKRKPSTRAKTTTTAKDKPASGTVEAEKATGTTG